MSHTMSYCVFSIPRDPMRKVNYLGMRFYEKKFYRTTLLLQAQTFNPFFKQKWTFLVRITLVWALICSFNTSNVSNPYPFTLLPGLTAICAIMSCPEYIFGHFQYFSIEILEFGQNKSLFWPLPVAGSEILFFQNITSFFKKHLQKTACQKLFPFSG